MTKELKKLGIGTNCLKLKYETDWDPVEDIKYFALELCYEIDNGKHKFYYEEFKLLSDALIAFDKISEFIKEYHNNEL